MERTRSLRFLKASVLVILSIVSHAQDWQEINSVELKDKPSTYSIDFQGNLYLGFEDGTLSKYDPSGEFLENFSLPNNSSINLIDVQNNLRPFLFYFDIQQITLLDRFSSVPKNYLLQDLGLDIVMMACPSPDGDFWILENNPQRLKKVDPLSQIHVLEVQISIGDSVQRMQAYQNILVISHEKGLSIFDQFGGLIQKLKIENFISFHIESNRLYAFTIDEILMIDPFKGTILEAREKPANSQEMLKSKSGFLSISNRTLIYYKLNKP